jgi:nicotinamidase/pyrazinamidase
MKVLILVDIQNDFCLGGALAVPQGDEVVSIANTLMRCGEFDAVVATQDYHPSNHISFADNHPGASVFQSIETPYGSQTLWPRHCVEGSFGAELHPLLDSTRIASVVPKGTDPGVDSYSGFFDNNHQRETGLRQLLERLAQENGRSLQEISLSVCGLALDYCVAATARDAIGLGIPTEVIIDACRAVNLNPGDDVRVMRELASLGVALQTSDQLLPGIARETTVELPRSIERGISC